MTQKHYVLQLIEHLNLSVRQFENETGVGGSTINKAIERNSKLGYGTVRKILDKYPFVNEEWLKTGEGEMLLKQRPSEAKNKGLYVSEEDSRYEKPDTLYRKAVSGIKQLYDKITYPSSKDIREMGETVENIEKMAEELERLREENERLKSKDKS